MKLFLLVRGFRDCLKIQYDLNRLAEWCEANALELNVGKCKSITFSRLLHPIEFSYMLGGIILDRVDSINDLGVIMDSLVSFIAHIDVTVGRASAMLGFVKRLSCEFEDPYTLKTLYVSLVRLKLEYTSCVWRPFYGAHIDRMERVQRKFVRCEFPRLRSHLNTISLQRKTYYVLVKVNFYAFLHAVGL
jgi:hypothetical protein